MTFEPGKEYRTRDGRRARVYADGYGGTIHGAVWSSVEDGWVSLSWELSGRVGRDAHDSDLMPPEQAEGGQVSKLDHAALIAEARSYPNGGNPIGGLLGLLRRLCDALEGK